VKFVIFYIKLQHFVSPITAIINYGLDYRWSLDFIRLVMTTPRSAKYVLLMVEHFSKWIELVALPHNSLKLAVLAFLDCVFELFGTPEKVLTN
jgi:hypothetical protein